jgi:hypothetical protein
MNRLVSSGLWKEVRRLAKSSGARMAAVAYVTSESVRFGAGDLLITDASKQAIESGQTSAAVLRDAYERGAELFSCPGLHAKVMLFDGVAVIGSANISRSSEDSLIEAALITDHPAAVSMTRAFLRKLQDDSEAIGESFLRRISAIKVKRRVGGRRAKKRPGVSVKLGQHRTWVIGLHDVDPERYPAEVGYVESGYEKAYEVASGSEAEVAWIRITKDRSRFSREAKVGDTVIQIGSESPKHKSPYAVHNGLTILHRQKEPNCTRFFVEYPPKAKALTWRQFQSLTKQVGLPYKLGRYSARLLPEEYADALNALWGESGRRK